MGWQITLIHMKRILATSLLVLFLSSCGLNGNFKDEADMVSFDGILEEQAVSDSLPGSHRLIVDDGSTILLRSLSINLSGSQYLNNEVEVTGVMNSDDDVLEVTGISVLEVLSEETKSHKLVEYQNTELGFKLKYYDDWELNEETDKISFLEEEDGNEILIEQFPFPYTPKAFEDGTMDTPLEAYFALNYPDVENVSSLVREVGVNRLDAAKLEAANGRIDYVIYRSGLIYKISLIPGLDSEKNSGENSLNQILADFQFIGMQEADLELPEDEEDGVSRNVSKLPTLDMKMTAFESLPYHFRASYPAAWYYSGSKKSGTLHHYGFSDQAFEDESGELIALDVISDSIPTGSSLELSNGTATKVSVNGNMVIYLEVDGQRYRISGPVEYEDLLLNMASGIEPLTNGE